MEHELDRVADLVERSLDMPALDAMVWGTNP